MRTLTIFAASLLAILWVAAGLTDSDPVLQRLNSLGKQVEVALAKKEQKRPFDLSPQDPLLETQLHTMMANYRLEFGAVTVIDVPTGKILAAAGSSIREPEQGRALAFTPRFPTASVFKVVAGAGLLEQASFDPQSCVGYRGGHRRVQPSLLIPRRGERRCATLEGMLSRSVNVAVARSVKNHLSHAELTDVAARLGFGKILPGAAAFGTSTADLPEDDNARAISAAGFGDHRISPYHAASMMAMIARGGRWAQQRPSGVPDQALNPAVARKLAKMLVATTQKGTARKVFRSLRGIAIAGKTGSLIVDGLDYSWFIGFAPAKDPRIAFAAVVVNDPKKLWHLRGTHLARAAVKAALFGDPPPRSRKLVAMR
jgi:cell division protein FtsI/penicillin-binding protein 2